MSEWYYRVMGQELGPVSDTQLKALARDGTIQPDTFVRKRQDDSWTNAYHVKGLFTTPENELPSSVSEERKRQAAEEKQRQREPASARWNRRKQGAKERRLQEHERAEQARIQGEQDRLAMKPATRTPELVAGILLALVVLVAGVRLFDPSHDGPSPTEKAVREAELRSRSLRRSRDEALRLQVRDDAHEAYNKLRNEAEMAEQEVHWTQSDIRTCYVLLNVYLERPNRGENADFDESCGREETKLRDKIAGLQLKLPEQMNRANQARERAQRAEKWLEDYEGKYWPKPKPEPRQEKPVAGTLAREAGFPD